MALVIAAAMAHQRGGNAEKAARLLREADELLKQQRGSPAPAVVEAEMPPSWFLAAIGVALRREVEVIDKAVE